GNDTLDGGTGNDRLIGDDRLRIAGVRLENGAGARALQIDGLIWDLDAAGGNDTLLGGDGDDVLIGDHELALAAAVIDSSAIATVSVALNELADHIGLGAGADVLDGGAGNDVLVGDHVASIAAVYDTRIAVGSPTGVLTLQVTQLVDRLELKAAVDDLRGGAGDDLLIGDSQSITSAATVAGVQLTGTRLIDNLDIRAEKDKLRGGNDNDTLVGDNDTTLIGSASGLARLVEALAVQAGTDDLNGELGSNVIEQGNRASTPTGLAKSVSIASRGTGTPSAPSIDWNGRLADGGAKPSAASWLESFVNRLARTPADDPNSRIKIKL
ncbi:MAG TPA: hypothetical protein VF936_11540, partial [Burkholderiales bacterium]